jgi:hypothetical protein
MGMASSRLPHSTALAGSALLGVLEEARRAWQRKLLAGSIGT